MLLCKERACLHLTFKFWKNCACGFNMAWHAAPAHAKVHAMHIYQAGPIFTEADEPNWHLKLKARLLTSGFEVVWPGGLLIPREIES